MLTSPERLLLFTLIYSLRSERYLEIGDDPGRPLLVGAAMDASDSHGRIVCIDGATQVDPPHWQKTEHRASMLVTDSGVALPKAREVAGGPFDFFFIDADHSKPPSCETQIKYCPFWRKTAVLTVTPRM
jgi:predicted O-methyltransferase YrrM